MFGTSLECGIKAVKVKVDGVEGRILRRCRVVLVHQFTPAIARELGKDAVALRAGLRALAIDKAVLPIGGVAALGAFTAGGETIKISRLIGVKATAIAPNEDSEAGATIQLEFEFQWDEAAWGFLGRHCAAVASVVLTKRQLTLAEAEGNN